MSNIARFINAGVLALMLSGCGIIQNNLDAQARVPDVKEAPKPADPLFVRMEELYKACDGKQKVRLDAVDSVMEIIVTRIRDTGANPDPQIKAMQNAGDKLFRLAISFYNGRISVKQCRMGVEIIKNDLNPLRGLDNRT